MRTTTTRSTSSFSQTVAHLTSAIAASGSTLFASIDQAAAARSVGLELRPTTLLVFGNPKGGTPLMAAFPAFAVQLPLKLVVAEMPDGVTVTRDRMAAVAPDYGVPADHPVIAAMDRALEALATALT